MSRLVSPVFRLVSSIALGAALLSGCGGGGGGKAPNVDVPLPAVAITASPQAIASGQSAMLTWNSPTAATCTASGGWSGTKAVSGTESTGALTATTDYTLSCSNAKGSTMQSVTVTVVPPPTVTLTATPSTVTLAQSTTLAWVVTDATSCTASGDWDGSKSPVGGSETTSGLLTDKTFTLTCTGIAGTAPAQTATVTVTPPPPNTVVVTGAIKYQRVPFKSTLGAGLDPDAPVATPVRYAVVQVLRPAPDNTVLATTQTDSLGNYAVNVGENLNVRVRVSAQSLKTGVPPTWNFRVVDNTDSDSLYVLDSAQFNTGAVLITPGHDLLAASGWTGSAYDDTKRAAAPFAILDTVIRSKDLVLGAAGNTIFKPLDLHWSTTNRPAGPLCPKDGNISSSFYVGAGAFDECVAPPALGQPLPAGIYILGELANSISDTDEFDEHVIAHEFGHYVEDSFSRSDSIGGIHGPTSRLDLRVAFGEGWGDAYSAMALNDPVYRDSGSGLSDDFGFNVETDNGGSVPDGWYSELSIAEVLFDLYDDATEPGDQVALGFAPLFAVMSGPQKNTDAFVSIFSFAAALRANNPNSAAAITTLLNSEGINGTDAFGTGETNGAGDTAAFLPVYRDIALGTQVQVCSRNKFDSESLNKLGNRAFLRFDNPTSRNIVVTAIGATFGVGTEVAVDPDIYVWNRGALVVLGITPDPNSETTPQTQFPAGTYIIEVYDDQLAGIDTPPRCMTVSVTGS